MLLLQLLLGLLLPLLLGLILLETFLWKRTCGNVHVGTSMRERSCGNVSARADTAGLFTAKGGTTNSISANEARTIVHAWGYTLVRTLSLLHGRREYKLCELISMYSVLSEYIHIYGVMKKIILRE